MHANPRCMYANAALLNPQAIAASQMDITAFNTLRHPDFGHPPIDRHSPHRHFPADFQGVPPEEDHEINLTRTRRAYSKRLAIIRAVEDARKGTT